MVLKMRTTPEKYTSVSPLKSFRAAGRLFTRVDQARKRDSRTWTLQRRIPYYIIDASRSPVLSVLVRRQGETNGQKGEKGQTKEHDDFMGLSRAPYWVVNKTTSTTTSRKPQAQSIAYSTLFIIPSLPSPNSAPPTLPLLFLFFFSRQPFRLSLSLSPRRGSVERVLVRKQPGRNGRRQRIVIMNNGKRERQF